MHIPVTHGRLEARLHHPPAKTHAAAVFCHPHPLYGGSMNTRVVYRVAQTLADCGIATLRFNFRGVGASTGSFDHGIGELQDARDAMRWLVTRYHGLPLVVGGFSFGSAIGLRAGMENHRTAVLVGAGIPLENHDYDLSPIFEGNHPLLVVQGQDDQFGNPSTVARALAPLGQRLTLETICGADHLFTGKTAELMEAVRRYFTDTAILNRLRRVATPGPQT